MVKLPKIKKFHISNDSLKELGEVIANEKGRRIIISLTEKEMYINEIAKKLNIPIGLVIHHIQKLEKLNLLEITEKPISKKTKNHRFFRITSDIFMEFTKEDDNKLKQIFKDGIKLASVAVSGMVSLLILNHNPNKILRANSNEDKFDLLNNSIHLDLSYFSLIVTSIVVSITIFLIFKIKKIKKGLG